MIPYGKQSINEDDIQAVVEVLRSDFITQGPVVPQFEQALAKYCGAEYCVLVSNGTAALHLSCLALDLSAGDKLWTSPNTFVASANCGLYCGAEVDFVDIDAQTHNMSVAALAEKLQTDSPDVLVPVDFSGQSCQMKEIAVLAKKHGFMVLEDASHALGGEYLGQKVGCCEFSDLATLSFHPVKMITTGEGGAVLTNDENLYEKLLLLRSHGITRETNLFTGPDQGGWYYQQQMLGFNYRLTEIQAALGLSQLSRLDEFVSRRTELANRYQILLADLPVVCPIIQPECQSSWHLYVVQIDETRTNQTRKMIFDKMRENDVGVNVHYIPVHQQPFYQQKGFQAGDYPQAEEYYHSSISLPLFPALSFAEQDEVVARLKQVIY
jgi:UDP-4-amino-4,6-dideoxy-N-acetyl-beta-L-altrosamine transaminase